jgi:hypothetical protein
MIAITSAIASCSRPVAESPARPERDAGATSESAPLLDAGRPTVDGGAALDATTDAGAVTIPLPEEPWYRDKAETYEDCVEPLTTPRARHFPPPFELCDPRAEIINPQGGSAHFHYRKFSQERTTARRATRAGTCCYLIWEFPRHAP